MVSARTARFCGALALAGLVLGVTPVDVGARPKPPVIEAPPEPPMPDVDLASRFVREAAAYEDYMREAETISPAFADAGGVARALREGASYEPEAFLRGEMAYAAIAALQDPVFVAAVRDSGPTPEARYAIVRKIYADPANVMTFAGARSAAGRAKDALSEDGMRLFDGGKAVKLAAYSIQHQAWSLTEVADLQGRLAAVKALSSAPRPVSSEETELLEQAVSGERLATMAANPAPPPYSPLIVRAVALAALAAVGQAGDDNAANLTWLLEDYFTAHCLAQAKLALNECLAVARPNYEDVFCLGQHAMNDTGSCVVRGAGSVVPLELATEKYSVPPAKGARRKGTHRKRS